MIPCMKIAVRALPKVSASSFSTQGAGIPRLRVVMDIDECMVHAFDMEEERRQWEDRGKVKANIAGLTTKALKMEDGLGVKLHVRPGLPEYLRELTELADVFAFTAGLPVYARPVINYLDPEQKIFKNVWYRDSCRKPSNGICVPDFYDNPKDDVLSEVLNVVKILQTEGDVKPALHDMFDLTGRIEKIKSGQ